MRKTYGYASRFETISNVAIEFHLEYVLFKYVHCASQLTWMFIIEVNEIDSNSWGGCCKSRNQMVLAQEFQSLNVAQ